MSGSNSQEYISHHLHFLQVDLRDFSVVDSVKVVPADKPAFDQCLTTQSHEECLKTVQTAKCKLNDLGSGECFAALPEKGGESSIVNPYTLNLDSLGLTVILGFIFLLLSAMPLRKPQVVCQANYSASLRS